MYRKVKCSDRLPEQEKSHLGELLRFTIPYHLETESKIRTVGYYDFELNVWFAEDYPEATIQWWLEEIPGVSVDLINECIQPHAITLEHGEKAAKDIHQLIYGEEGEG